MDVSMLFTKFFSFAEQNWSETWKCSGINLDQRYFSNMKNRRVKFVKYLVFFLQVVRGIVNRLFSRKALWQSDPEKISKFLLLKAREQWRANNAVNDRVFIHFSCCCCGLLNEQSSARVMKCTSSIICDALGNFLPFA